MRGGLWTLVALSGAGLLVGCGAAPTPGTNARRGPGGAAAASAAALPEPGRFHGPGRPTWSGPGGWTHSSLESALLQAVGRAITPSAALDCLAREYAARFAADGADPDPATVSALAHHCGAWAPPARALAMTGKDRAAVEKGLASVAAEGLSGAVGLGAVTQPDGRVTCALVFPSAKVTLEPLRKDTRAGVLRGQAGRVDGALELWRHTDTLLGRIPLDSKPTGEFESPVVRAEGETVRYELAARQGRFRQTLAQIVLGPSPTAYTPTPRRPRPPLATVRQQAIEAINGARRGAGLPPLRPQPRLRPALDEWLARVAAGQGGDAPQGLLDREGRAYAKLAFALGEGADGAQAAALILQSPTGRATLLDPELGQLGVGARPFDRGEGVDLVVAALRPFEGTRPDVARVALRARLDAARRAAGQGALAGAPALDAVAQGLAEEALAGTLPWAQVAEQAALRLAKAAAVKGAYAVGGLTVIDPAQADFSGEQAALAPGATVVGLGVAGGPLPTGGTPRHVVIYLVADALAAGTKRAPRLGR